MKLQLLSRSLASSGFTIIEMVITLGLLLSISVAAAIMLRNGVDVRSTLAEQNRVTQRLARAMERIARDMEHALIVPNTDPERGIQERNFNTLFRIEKAGDIDRLTLTTMSAIFKRASGAESDTAYVVYELKQSQNIQGRRDLYRGEISFQQRDRKEEPETHLVSANIKSLKLTPWNGDAWSADRWDSSRGETRNKLPRMVRIDLETWAEDPLPDEAINERMEGNVVSLKSIVYLQYAENFPELKQQSLNIKWF